MAIVPKLKTAASMSKNQRIQCICKKDQRSENILGCGRPSAVIKVMRDFCGHSTRSTADISLQMSMFFLIDHRHKIGNVN